MSGLALYVPMALPSVANLREHRARKARRVASQRKCVEQSLLDLAGKPPPLPLVVTLSRVSPKRLDDDNWIAAAKACRDGVADWLGIDDRSPRVQWRYEQFRGEPREQVLLIEVEPGQEPPSDAARLAAFHATLERALRAPGLPTPVRQPKRAPRGRRASATSKPAARREAGMS